MSKKEKKMGKNKASEKARGMSIGGGKTSILKMLAEQLPTHLANRKVKKPKKKDWMTFSAETDYRINARLLQAFQDNYAEEKAKAETALAAAFAYTPDPERPVQFAMPRALEKVEALVQSTNKYFCVQETAPWGNGDNGAEFEKMADGGFHVAAANKNGEHFADINMTAEQFAAFKQWVMEN